MVAMNPSIPIITHCPQCDQETAILVTDAELADWLAHTANIQDILLRLTPAEREMLITGICGPCWDKIMSHAEED